MTCEIPGIGTTRWTRVDPDRYFLVLSARTEEFYDHSGSAFPVVIKLAGEFPQSTRSVSIQQDGKAAFGTVPRRRLQRPSERSTQRL